MKKLIVWQPKEANNKYAGELYLAKRILPDNGESDLLQIELSNLSADFLNQNEIDVVLSTGLPKEWYLVFSALKIVNITFGDLKKYKELADIVIDHLSDVRNRYFVGSECSLKNLDFAPEFIEITDLIKILDWDTSFWGFPVSYLSCRNLTESIIYRTDHFIKDKGVKLVEYLCNCHDNESVKLAAKNNYIFTDIRLSFELKLKEKRSVALFPSLTFELATEDDIPNLREMAKDIFIDSRYYFDRNFNREKASEFYQGWVEKAVRGTFDDECYCLYDRNQPIGFCTIKFSPANTARIGLIGLSNDYRGQGLAMRLLYLISNKLIEKNISSIQVATQGRNYAAQRLYQKVGFLTKATELWYHKWL